MAGLDGDGGGAGIALQALWGGEAIPLVADLSQEARGELRSGAGERAEEIAVGMLGEERFDGSTIGEELVGENGVG